ncbi:MAG TPA: Rid family hydrolase [Steroidobacteraceae bacterium]|jgi:2-iminobutanoate/2-iminopropanoate deaminase|nr:Rid family hydrolase [Steroidobacteraceae bacterium]
MEIIRTENAPKPPPYFSQAVKAGGLIFVAGQGPFDPVTGQVVGESIQEQTAQSMRNVAAILTAAGSSLAKVVDATFILAEGSDFPGMNEEWVKWFPRNPPARHAAQLPVRPQNMRISIAVIAEA